jgi:hypothetical protein
MYFVDLFSTECGELCNGHIGLAPFAFVGARGGRAVPVSKEVPGS